MSQRKLYSLIWAAIAFVIGGVFSNMGWTIPSWISFAFMGMAILTFFN
tara:strand:+ start:1268 stop:1411 length:144 start_codon:yes stop_codon:yes gene_type:complete